MRSRHASCGRKSKNHVLPLVAFDVEWPDEVRRVTCIGAWSWSASLLSKALAGKAPPVWSNFSGEGCGCQNQEQVP